MLKKIFITLITTILLQNTALCTPLTIYTTNDLHGRLKPFDYKNEKNIGGAARRTTILKEKANSLILDAGDFAQGTLYFKLLEKNINLQVMEKQSYDAITLGNHEFDKGIDYIKKSVFATNIPFVSCNIKFKDKELNKKIKKYIIKEINGIKVAITGNTEKALKAQCSANPKTYEVFDETKSLKKLVKKIDKKSDLIVVLSHSGLEKDKEIAQKVKNIDLIVGGHSHTNLVEPLVITTTDGKKVLISQNGEFGTVLGRWDIDVENDEIKEYKFQQIPINSAIKEDLETANLINKYDIILKEYSKTVVGETTKPVDARRDFIRSNLTTAGALLHQAIKATYPEVEISFNTSGGYRYGEFLPTQITKEDISNLFPFESYLIILEVKGSDIISILETSSRFSPLPSSSFLQTYGISYTIDTTKQPQILNTSLTKITKKGSRVSDIKINNKALNPDKYYTIATDNFLYFGGDGYTQLKKYKKVKHTYHFLDKILLEYLESNSPVNVKVKDKIIFK